ncbi:eCIS core domain-containing protein [Streptomyces europaeiscabiei]|uniref:eCIS core domain-containing protein n=1 Tax=Streptomyces europaeiscabiei TaxID=146819 RepID=UPI0038F69DF0
MRKRGSDKAGDERKTDRASAVTVAGSPARRQPDLSSAQGLLALQGTTGNAAVVQLLRRAGHSWAQEEHRHSADCGHQSPAEPTVQRSAVHDVLRAPGQPLDSATRTDMEARLDADFSDVRIHNDSVARASAAEVGARAYTSGSHVVIGDGGADKHTLAHELTHVIQQRQGPVAGTDNGGGLKVSDPSDRFEQAAEANAHRVMSGPARPAVQRAADSRRTSTDSHGVHFGAVVQRAPGDPQELLHEKHWKDKMTEAGFPLLPPKAPKKKGKASAAPKRKLEDVLKTVGPGLLAQLAEKSGKGTERLKLYRSMFTSEAVAIMEWKGKAAETEAWMQTESKDGSGIAKRYRETVDEGRGPIGAMPVKNHLGDVGQAEEYFADEDAQVLMEFTLKEGAEELLFHPEYMAISGDKGTPYHIRKTREAETGSEFPQAAAGEGTLPGYIGLKPEKKEPFSLSIGDTDITRLLFQLFVEDVRAVKGEKNL